MTIERDIAAGAIGGLAGGLVMTAFMVIGSRVGLVDEPLPQKTEHWVEDQMGVRDRPAPLQEEIIGQGSHLVFAAALGALYGGFLASRDLPALPTGPLFGLASYAVDLAGIGPALGITKGPWNEEPTTIGRRMMMHTVFGTVTALVTEQLRRELQYH
jgi:hypothetical protein